MVEPLTHHGRDHGWHPTVNFGCQADESSLKIQRLELPSEIMRIDRNAVTSQSWARMEWNETKGFSRGCVDYFVDIYAQYVTHQRQFIDHPDVDTAKGVLKKFDHLGAFGAGDGNDSLNELRIEDARHLGALCCYAADDFWGIAGVKDRIAGIDSFRGKGKKEVFS